MTEQDRADLLALTQSYRRNRPALIQALQRAGLPSAWLTSWEAKLDRLERTAKAETEQQCSVTP